jgi:hypothetical protein
MLEILFMRQDTKTRGQVNKENTQLILTTDRLNEEEKKRALLILKCGIPVNLDELILKLRN